MKHYGEFTREHLKAELLAHYSPDEANELFGMAEDNEFMPELFKAIKFDEDYLPLYAYEACIVTHEDYGAFYCWDCHGFDNYVDDDLLEDIEDLPEDFFDRPDWAEWLVKNTSFNSFDFEGTRYYFTDISYVYDYVCDDEDEEE